MFPKPFYLISHMHLTQECQANAKPQPTDKILHMWILYSCFLHTFTSNIDLCLCRRNLAKIPQQVLKLIFTIHLQLMKHKLVGSLPWYFMTRIVVYQTSRLTTTHKAYNFAEQFLTSIRTNQSNTIL